MGSMSQLPFFGVDVMPGFAFPRSAECYPGPLGLGSPGVRTGITPCPAVLCVATTAFVLPGRSALCSLPVPWVDALCFVPLPACAGHPCSGDYSQGDGRLSRVPRLPFCSHAPLSDPGGVPPACLGAHRTVAFQSLHTVGFGSGCPDLSFVHDYTFFGVQ